LQESPASYAQRTAERFDQPQCLVSEKSGTKANQPRVVAWSRSRSGAADPIPHFNAAVNGRQAVQADVTTESEHACADPPTSRLSQMIGLGIARSVGANSPHVCVLLIFGRRNRSTLIFSAACLNVRQLAFN